MRKNGNPGICNTMNGPWGHYAKWDKSDRERQISYHLNVETKKATFIKWRVKCWLLGATGWGNERDVV